MGMGGAITAVAATTTVHIDVDHAVPFAGLELIDVGELHQTSIVQKDVDRVVGIDQLLDAGFDGGRIDHVHLDHESFAAVFRNFNLQGFEAIGTPGRDTDVDASSSQFEGRGRANTARCTSNQRDFSIDARHS